MPWTLLDGVPYFVRVELDNGRVSSGGFRFQHGNWGAADWCADPYITTGVTSSGTLDHGTVSVFRVQYTASGGNVRSPRWCVQLSISSGTQVHVGLQATADGDMTAKLKVYDSLAGAINARDANLLGETRTRTMAVFGSVVQAHAVPLGVATASVERGFAAFAGAAPTGRTWPPSRC